MPAVIVPALFPSLVAGTVGYAVAHLLAGVAFSALSTAIMGGAKAESRPGIQTQFPGTGDVTPQSIILGRYATAGHKMAPAYTFSKSSGGGGTSAPDSYYGRTGSGKYVTLIRSLSDTPLSGLAGIYVDGTWFDFADHFVEHEKLGRAVGGSNLDATQAGYVGRVWLDFYDGTQTEASQYLVGAYSNHAARPWSADAIHAGGAYVVVTLKLDYDLFERGEPEIMFVVDGMPLLDPRTNIVGPTNNPAVMAWNIYQSIQIDDATSYGVGLPRSALPDPVWFSEMNKCDLGIDVEGVLEPQYRAGYEIKIAQPEGGGVEPLDVIDMLMPACSGNIAEIGGDIHIRTGAPGLPVAAISDDDLLWSEAESVTPVRGIGEIHNSVAATFPNPAEKWQPTDADTVTDLDAVAELGDTRQGQVDLSAAPWPNQVKRLMEAWVKDAQRQEVHGFFLPARWAASMVPLATVVWASVAHGYDGKLFEIQDRLLDPMTGQIGLVVREVDPDDFSAFGINYKPISISPNPTQVIPFELGNFTAAPLVQVDSDGVERRGGIRGEWDSGELLSDPVVLDFRVFGNDAISFSDVQPDGSAGYLNSFHNAMLPNTAYQVRATGLIPGSTLPSPWVTVTTPNVLLGTLDVAGLRRNRALEIIAAIRSGKNKREFAKLVAGFDGTLIDLQDESAQAIDAVSNAGLQARAILQAALEGQLDTTNADLAQLETLLTAEIDHANAEIAATKIAYAAADLVLAGQISSLTATVDGNTAAISDTDTAVVALDVATANRFSTVEAEVDDNAAGLTAEETARANADGAMAGRLDAVEADSGSNQAAIAATQQALATSDAAFAQFEQGATADIDGLETTVAIQGNVLSDVEGNQNASLVLRADGAELVVVSANDPTGPPITSIFLGAQYVFVNGALQSANFNAATKTGWRLKLDGSFEFYGELTRSAFANGELQFNYASFSKRYSAGTHNFAEDGVFIGVLIGAGGGGQLRPASHSVGGSAGGVSIIIIPNAKKDETFTISIGAGGLTDDQTPTNGEASTFLCSAHGKSATAGGGEGADGSTPGNGGTATGGYRNYTGGKGSYGFQSGGFGTPRFGSQAKNASGGNSGSPFIDTIKMDAFFLLHSTFDELSPEGKRWGCGARSYPIGQGELGRDGEDGVFIGGYLLAGDYS